MQKIFHIKDGRFLDDFTRKDDVIFKPNIELTSYSLVVEFAKMGFDIGYVTKEYVKELIKIKSYLN